VLLLRAVRSHFIVPNDDDEGDVRRELLSRRRDGRCGGFIASLLTR
jgi:hypothetical protein